MEKKIIVLAKMVLKPLKSEGPDKLKLGTGTICLYVKLCCPTNIKIKKNYNRFLPMLRNDGEEVCVWC